MEGLAGGGGRAQQRLTSRGPGLKIRGNPARPLIFCPLPSVYDAGGRPHPKAVDGRLSGASRCSTRPPREGSGPWPVVARQAGPRRRRPPGSSFVSSNGSRVSPAGTAGPEEACGWTSPAGESRRGQVCGRRGRRCARRVSDPACARGRRVRAGGRAGSATPLGVVRVPAAEALCAASVPGAPGP